jgi:deazaflavin-dependent oxidoreductase (nitroreductase family)
VLRRLTPPRPLLIPIWIIHRAVYRATSGRVGGSLLGMKTLLLTTVGRRSGQPRQASLYYLEDEGKLYVVASNAGSGRDPEWWLNLQASPDAVVWLGPVRRRVRARRASPAEIARVWPQLVAMNPGYEQYRTQTDRELPVVILESRA